MQLFKHQLEAVDWSYKRRRMILADDTGLGKTASAIAIAENSPSPNPVLVVVPNLILAEKWAGEIEAWTGQSPRMLLASTKPKELVAPPDRWNITTYSALNTAKRLEFFIAYFDQFDHVIFDEAHALKNAKAKRTRQWKTWCASAPRETLLMLTATPLTKSPEDLVSELNVLDALDDRPYTEVCDEFLSYIKIPTKHSYTRICTGWKSEDASLRFQQQYLSPLLLRRTKADLEEPLPPMLKEDLYMDVTKNDLKSKTGAILKQWRNPRDPEMAEAHAQLMAIGQLKAEGVADFLADTVESDFGQRVVVFFKFRVAARALIEKLEKRPGIEVYAMMGDMPQERRTKTVNEFLNSKHPAALVTSYAVSGVGIDLVDCQRVVLAEADWSPAVIKQAIDRIYRIGQTKATLCQRVIAKLPEEARDAPIEKRTEKLLARKYRMAEQSGTGIV